MDLGRAKLLRFDLTDSGGGGFIYYHEVKYQSNNFDLGEWCLGAWTSKEVL